MRGEGGESADRYLGNAFHVSDDSKKFVKKKKFGRKKKYGKKNCAKGVPPPGSLRASPLASGHAPAPWTPLD